MLIINPEYLKTLHGLLSDHSDMAGLMGLRHAWMSAFVMLSPNSGSGSE